MYTFRKPTVFQPAKENKTSFTTPQKKTVFLQARSAAVTTSTTPSTFNASETSCRMLRKAVPRGRKGSKCWSWWFGLVNSKVWGFSQQEKKTITSLTTEAWYSIPRSSWIVCFLELGSLCTASICAVSSVSLMIRSRCGRARMLIHRQRAFIHPKYVL